MRIQTLGGNIRWLRSHGFDGLLPLSLEQKKDSNEYTANEYEWPQDTGARLGPLRGGDFVNRRAPDWVR